ncbi:MAG: Ig-like domain-containing protein, partial [Candidatus Thermoplasmatota archaeon]|nr:Ig-like domain-containing protein [Candidatus Thermoplasmatota archaeon]
VQWATDILFSQNVMESSWLTDTNYRVFDIDSYRLVDTRSDLPIYNYPLNDGIYYIRVRSRDDFEQLPGWGNSMRTVVDTTAPEMPTINNLPTYSGGTGVRIGWEKVFDPAGTGIEYRVQVFENETGDPIRETSWVNGLSMDISDLTAYNTYHFKVQARDALGWISDPSASTSTTMDIDGPKITMLSDGIFGPTETHIVGDAMDAGCGVDIVEFSVDGGLTWAEAEYAIDRWSVPKNSLPSGTKEMMVRGQDLGGNIGTSVMAYIDEAPPVITISYPTGGMTVTGVTSIIGSVVDDHLTSYSISYLREGAEEWEVIVPTQTTGGVSGLLGTWAPDGLSGGEYTIKVTAVDSLGMISEETLNVTIAGANLNIDPAQITFSNPHPLPGDKVTVMVTILNFGDSPAEGVTLVIKDDDETIYTESDILIPANGITVVTTEITASGTHTITAQATSELYNSGEMSQGAVLTVSEEESVLENAGGILGLLALILAIIAILAILLMVVFRGKKEKEPKQEDEKEEEAEKEEEMDKAPSLSLPEGEPEKKPALPEAPKQISKTPALPSASSPTAPPVPPAPEPVP